MAIILENLADQPIRTAAILLDFNGKRHVVYCCYIVICIYAFACVM